MFTPTQFNNYSREDLPVFTVADDFPFGSPRPDGSGFPVRSCTIKTEDSIEYAVVLNQMKNRFDTMTEG